MGKWIAIKSVWVRAIELEAMNELLLNAGYDVRVNRYLGFENEAPVWSGSERSRAEGDYTILKGRSLRDSSSGNLCSVKL